MLTIDEAIMHPQAHKVGAIPHVLSVTAAGGRLALGQLVLMVWKFKIPAGTSRDQGLQ